MATSQELSRKHCRDIFTGRDWESLENDIGIVPAHVRISSVGLMEIKIKNARRYKKKHIVKRVWATALFIQTAFNAYIACEPRLYSQFYNSLFRLTYPRVAPTEQSTLKKPRAFKYLAMVFTRRLGSHPE